SQMMHGNKRQLAGHIYASRLIGELEFPLVALVVSGGHTDLIYMKSHGHYEVIGQTRDDAAGEAYDKIARTLALPYPGGPEIDRLAARGEDIFQFPRAWLEPESYDFSFSGLKSAVLNRLNEAKQKGEELKKEDVACSFQESVIEVL
ncbi:tRNA (adenosine(37)-N6)-threonylcarbamoyltransferase complex transferase subunit TsaD, partial [Escherichia coli]